MKPVDEWSIYVITDRALSKGRSHEEVVRRAILGGVDVVQLRDKEAPTAQLYREALLLRDMAKKMNIPLIINDRVDVALAVDADGVHLGQDDLPLSIARRMLGPEKIIGISTHSFQQARAASLTNPDYISIGPIYPTKTKETGPAVGVEIIRLIKDTTPIPVVAIGGITLENVGEVSQSGADCVALISSIVSAEDIEATARAFKAKMTSQSKTVAQENREDRGAEQTTDERNM